MKAALWLAWDRSRNAAAGWWRYSRLNPMRAAHQLEDEIVVLREDAELLTLAMVTGDRDRYLTPSLRVLVANTLCSGPG